MKKPERDTPRACAPHSSSCPLSLLVLDFEPMEMSTFTVSTPLHSHHSIATSLELYFLALNIFISFQRPNFFTIVYRHLSPNIPFYKGASGREPVCAAMLCWENLEYSEASPPWFSIKNKSFSGSGPKRIIIWS